MTVSRQDAYSPRPKRGDLAVTEESTEGRRYEGPANLPALASREWALDNMRQQVLEQAHFEVCSGWRKLTDMRFRPLGFLPIASASVMIELQSNLGGEGYPAPMQITAFAVFGTLVSAYCCTTSATCV